MVNERVCCKISFIQSYKLAILTKILMSFDSEII